MSTEQAQILEVFHRCWGQCTDSPSYDKAAWKQLQMLLERRDRAPKIADALPSDHPDLHEAACEALGKAILRTEQFGKFYTAHDGFAKLEEEMDELKEHVWMKERLRDLPAMRKEALDVAVVALRFAAHVCTEEIGRR